MTDHERLADLTVGELTRRLATSEPVPGGGSASALAGAMGAALVAMVVELTSGRPEAADHQAELDRIGSASAARWRELLELADRDAAAYAAVVAARRLPRGTEQERSARASSIVEATRLATRMPLATAVAASAVLDLAVTVAPIGNRNAASDAGVAAQLAAAALRGAALNVSINLPSLPAGDPLRTEAPARLDVLLADAPARETAARMAVEARMGAAPSA
jgi:formiminotetrahydrofolate cyclodeaminase